MVERMEGRRKKCRGGEGKGNSEEDNLGEGLGGIREASGMNRRNKNMLELGLGAKRNSLLLTLRGTFFKTMKKSHFLLYRHIMHTYMHLQILTLVLIIFLS